MDLVEDSLRDLAIKGVIHILNINDETLVYYTPPFHVAENNVSRKVVELSRVELDDFNVDIDKKNTNHRRSRGN